MKSIIIVLAIGLSVILIALVILNSVTKLEMKTDVVFNAPKEKVWTVLTDMDKYSEWNPFIISMQGEMKLGGRITNIMVNQGKETTFTPVITAFKENETLAWLGSGLGGMFKGNHYFNLTETDEGKTKMVHGEKFSGLLSGLIIQLIGDDTHANFKRMNEAMQLRVEET